MGCEEYDDDSDEIDKSDAITTATQQQWAATEPEMFHLGPSDVHGYKCDDGDDADVDEEEESSQADVVLMQTLEDWGHSTRECEDGTVYFRPVKYDNGEANVMKSNVCEAKTVL